MPRYPWFRIVFAGAALFAVLCAVSRHSGAAAADPATVQWQKDPALIQETLTNPAQVFSFHEVMVNQGDPAGFGGFAFTIVFDAAIWQPPDVDMTAAVNLFAASGRTLSCWPAGSSSNSVQMVCASTGSIGSGPTWSGPKTLGTVSLQLLPSVANTILSSGSGGVTTTIQDTAVKVTNSCGQPLNDGTIQPLPGQPECQGNLLPGLAAGGVVLTPGSTKITILPPASTATRTPSVTPTVTAAARPSSTAEPTHAVPTSTVERTATAVVTRTVTVTRTPPTVTGTTVTVTPPATGTAPVATAPVSTSTAHPRVTTTARPSATAPPSTCTHDYGYWRGHREAWPVHSLQLGKRTYSQDELLGLLGDDSTSDASLVLARELIAAKLNLAIGIPDTIEQSVIQSDAQLSDHDGALPFHLSTDDPSAFEARGMTWTAGALATFNNRCLAGGALGGAVTPVSGVLGSTGGRSPSGLPSTGFRIGQLGFPTAMVITGLCLIIVILAAALVRLTLLDSADQ